MICYLHVFTRIYKVHFFFKDKIILHPNSIIFALKNRSPQRKHTSLTTNLESR